MVSIDGFSHSLRGFRNEQGCEREEGAIATEKVGRHVKNSVRFTICHGLFAGGYVVLQPEYRIK